MLYILVDGFIYGYSIVVWFIDVGFVDVKGGILYFLFKCLEGVGLVDVEW